jgi:major type 1 subunit fimbrin (pilin)
MQVFEPASKRLHTNADFSPFYKSLFFTQVKTMMKKALVSSAIAAAALIAMAPAAHAVDGTITFNGSISGTTCTINGGNNNLSVNLQNVSSTSFPTVGTSSGKVPFQIALTNCQVASGGTLATKVHSYFEPGATIDTASGRLNLTGANPATGVQIAVWDSTGANQVKLGAADAEQNSPVANITAGGATLSYMASYVSNNAAVTAGPANSSVQYTLVYE